MYEREMEKEMGEREREKEKDARLAFVRIGPFGVNFCKIRNEIRTKAKLSSCSDIWQASVFFRLVREKERERERERERKSHLYVYALSEIFQVFCLFFDLVFIFETPLYYVLYNMQNV